MGGGEGHSPTEFTTGLYIFCSGENTTTGTTVVVLMPCGLHKSAGCCGDIANRIFVKHFFSWNISCTKESENAQLYKHLSPSNSFACTKKIWKIPNHKRDVVKMKKIQQMPSCYCPAGNNLLIPSPSGRYSAQRAKERNVYPLAVLTGYYFLMQHVLLVKAVFCSLCLCLNSAAKISWLFTVIGHPFYWGEWRQGVQSNLWKPFLRLEKQWKLTRNAKHRNLPLYPERNTNFFLWNWANLELNGQINT